MATSLDYAPPVTSAQSTPRGGIRSVCVVGGGTAGYFAALALKKRFASLDVTVIESSRIPVIGVGEATTTLMPPFLYTQLGLDVLELHRSVKPTWKLGIRFDWGVPGDHFFTYPFGASDPYEAYAFERSLDDQSLTSMLMVAGRSPLIREDDGSVTSLLPMLKHAYHLDNAPFVAFLARSADAAGIGHRDAVVDEVALDASGSRIESLRLDDGTRVAADLFVDASGFRSRLLGQGLGTPFESYASTLLCDTAVVATVPHDGHVSPYTRAETMDHGWCWEIPVERESHRGYVFSSRFASIDQAADEMRRKNPGMSEPWVVRFRSGRHRDFWSGNTFAVGNAYGFVEPLESTALHMVIVELAYVIGALAGDAGGRDAPFDTASVSEKVGRHWDYLRWFLGLHYRFNRRLDTPFWTTCRAEVELGPLDALVERVRTDGPWRRGRPGEHYMVGDPSFGLEGAMMLLLGQELEMPIAPPTTPRARWEARREEQRRLVARAMPQAQALEWLRAHPEHLVELATHPASWCRSPSELLVSSRAEPTLVFPKNDRPGSAPAHRYSHLLQGLEAKPTRR